MQDLNLITVDEFGQYAPEVDTSQFNAPTISGMIAAASKEATDYIEYTPLAEDIVDEIKTGMITTEGDLVIYPQKIPIISVASIGIVRGTLSVSLSLTAGGINRYNIDFNGTNIRYPYQETTVQGGSFIANFMSLRSMQFYTKISYRAGWEPSALPAPIKQAVVMLTKNLLTGQYNATGVTQLSQGSLSMSFGNRTGKPPLVQSAYRLLNPYRRIG